MGNLTDSLARVGGGVAVGDVLGGKYRVEGLLGEGAMGVVFAARQVALDRLVALKLLPAELARDPVLVARFLREGRAAARLQSDHAVKVIDVDTMPSGAPYMVLEHLDGADLGQVLARRGRLDAATACDFVLQACEAVGEAHSLGIVHRDLKPENLFVTTRLGGQPLIKVLDFGVSKLLSAAPGALTSTDVTLGSPVYMAPEQMLASRGTDARADVWALGVVLYELLTQRYPFEADSLPDLCMKVTREPPVSITSLRADLPAALVAIVERCLERNPGGRFADARELATALRQVVAPETVAESCRAPRTGDLALAETHAAWTADAPSWWRRRAVVALVVAAGALAAAAVTLGPPGPARTVGAAGGGGIASAYVEPPRPVALSPPPAAIEAPSASVPAPPPRVALPVIRAQRRPAPVPKADDDIPAFR